MIEGSKVSIVSEDSGAERHDFSDVLNLPLTDRLFTVSLFNLAEVDSHLFSIDGLLLLLGDFVENTL